MHLPDVLRILARAAEVHPAAFVLHTTAYWNAAEAIDRLGTDLTAPAPPGHIRLTTLAAYELEALWAVHDALVRARDREPGTDSLRELLHDITEYSEHTPDDIVDDVRLLLTVLALDLPVVTTLTTTLLLDRARDHAFHTAYRDVTNAWTNAGTSP
ncbi:hypothetical protein ACFWA9_21540 [Kitasatospora sp. NPDC059973]|uniref:hypothetical protein n=1 Tax=Kitasatospora sp. NPDC059973 TaxID=3347020 RepID=UPI00368DF736